MDRDEISRLSELLVDMDVPARRRDVTSWSNLAWLERNLVVHNGDREGFDEARWLVRCLLDGRRLDG